MSAPVMTARERNKANRRERILQEARHLLVAEGYDGLTTRALARAADVTVPTVYNLIGNKDAVIAAIVLDVSRQIWSRWDAPAGGPYDLKAVDEWLAACVGVIAGESQTVRAVAIATDRLVSMQAFSDRPPPEALAVETEQSIAMAEHLCRELQASGVLMGRVSAHQLAWQMYRCFRDALRDWVYGQLDRSGLEQVFAQGVYMLLCSDAGSDAQSCLVARIQRLQPAQAPTDDPGAQLQVAG